MVRLLKIAAFCMLFERLRAHINHLKKVRKKGVDGCESYTHNTRHFLRGKRSMKGYVAQLVRAHHS